MLFVNTVFVVIFFSVSDLITWINSETAKRGWSNNQLARRMGMSSAGFSLVVTGKNQLSMEFCVNLARALGEPPEKILRMAGFLPMVPPVDPSIQEVVEVMKNLGASDREDVVAYAKLRYQRAQSQR